MVGRDSTEVAFSNLNMGLSTQPPDPKAQFFRSLCKLYAQQGAKTQASKSPSNVDKTAYTTPAPLFAIL